MLNFEIPMIPEGDGNSAYRARLAPGESFQTTLLNQGNHGSIVKNRVVIVKLVTGTITPGGDPATLIVFEFQFYNKGNHRFTSAEVSLEFEDASAKKSKTGNHKLDPVVHKIGPVGAFALKMETNTSSITRSFDASINGGWNGIVGGSLGYKWEMTKDIKEMHYTSLTGTKDNKRDGAFGEDNAAVWWVDEDSETHEGIPNWLRTAVLLKRSHNGPFCVSLAVKTGVDFISELTTFWGLGRTEPIDPVTVDSELKIDSDEFDAAALADMGNLPLVECAKAAFVTPFGTDN